MVYGRVAALNIDPIEKKPFSICQELKPFRWAQWGVIFNVIAVLIGTFQSPNTGKIEGETTPEKIIETTIVIDVPVLHIPQ